MQAQDNVAKPLIDDPSKATPTVIDQNQACKNQAEHQPFGTRSGACAADEAGDHAAAWGMSAVMAHNLGQPAQPAETLLAAEAIKEARGQS